MNRRKGREHLGGGAPGSLEQFQNSSRKGTCDALDGAC